MRIGEQLRSLRKVNEAEICERAVIKAIIFDLNGTLLNDYVYNIQAFQMVFEQFNLSISKEDIGKWMGKPTSYIIEQILLQNGIKANCTELAKEKVDIYITITGDKDIFFPETKEAIHELSKTYKLGLFTGVTRKQVNILGDFLERFELVVAGEEAIKPKPAPDTLLYMVEKMGVRPHECVYVGDMPQDMLLARNAGITGIGIENEVFSKEALMEAGANKVIRDLKELTKCASVPIQIVPPKWPVG